MCTLAGAAILQEDIDSILRKLLGYTCAKWCKTVRLHGESGADYNSEVPGRSEEILPLIFISLLTIMITFLCQKSIKKGGAGGSKWRARGLRNR